VTGPARAGRALAGAALALVALLTTTSGALAAPRRSSDTRPTLTLVDQTKGTPPGGAFSLALRASGVPAGATVEITVHDRVRSRSELASTFDGKALRRAVRTQATAVAALPTDADGTMHDAVDLTGSGAAGPAITTPGVYPTAVSLVDQGGADLAGFVTDLLVLPATSTSAPPLDVAVLAEGSARPRRTEEPAADAATVDDMRDLAGALAAVPDVTATLALRPETLESIAASTTDAATAVIAALRALAANHPTLALPYVATSPDERAGAGLADELPRLVDHGTAVLARVLGTAPSESAWLAEPDLGGTGLSLLAALGVREVVVDPSHVEGLGASVLTPARPFELAPPRPSSKSRSATSAPAAPLRALATDARLDQHLRAKVGPALLANRVLADLAALWFEQPGTRRAVVLPISQTVDGGAVRQVLQGLRQGALFHPVALDQAFTDVAPLTSRGGRAVKHALVPAPTAGLAPGLAADVRSLRAQRDSVQEMVGAASPIVADIDTHLMRAMAAGTTSAQRRDELAGARASVRRFVDAIDTPPTFTITLTARNGTVPLTIRNDTGGPVRAQVRLRSSKAVLPGGRTIAVTIEGPSMRLDIAVRTRASGAFPIQVEVTSPDGRLSVASSLYSVRSTAVSGLGLLLSIGAGLFLVVWWARHWRSARRSARLVNSSHPAVTSARDAVG
jgi:hypothetical protein